jgi:hypothetical protein
VAAKIKIVFAGIAGVTLDASQLIPLCGEQKVLFGMFAAASYMAPHLP